MVSCSFCVDVRLNINNYYMDTSVNRQDESNPALCFGYPSGQDGAILSARDYPPCPARKISPKAI